MAPSHCTGTEAHLPTALQRLTSPVSRRAWAQWLRWRLGAASPTLRRCNAAPADCLWQTTIVGPVLWRDSQAAAAWVLEALSCHHFAVRPCSSWVNHRAQVDFVWLEEWLRRSLVLSLLYWSASHVLRYRRSAVLSSHCSGRHATPTTFGFAVLQAVPNLLVAGHCALSVASW